MATALNPGNVAVTMRKIAVVGSGQAGLLVAHGLLQVGYDVALYSDRTPADWLARVRIILDKPFKAGRPSSKQQDGRV